MPIETTQPETATIENAQRADLSELGMLVSLTIGQWSAKANDRKASNQVAIQNQSNPTMGRYVKQLLKAESLTLFRKASDEARATNYFMTNPWLDGGSRILSNELFFQHRDQMAWYKAECEKQAEIFAYTEYNDAVKKAESYLGGLFNQNDYPDAETIRQKFDFRITYNTLPSENDWRIRMPAEMADELVRETRNNMEASQNKIMADLFGRIHEVVSKMQGSLEDPDKRFRDSLFGNVLDLIEIMPGINVMKDPTIDKMVNDMKLGLCKYDPQDVREDTNLRKQLASEAQGILNRLDIMATGNESTA